MGLDAWLAGWPAWEVAGSLGEQAEFVVNPGKFMILCTFHRKAKVAIRRKAKVFSIPSYIQKQAFSSQQPPARPATQPNNQPSNQRAS